MKPCPIHLLCGGGSLANPIDNTDTPFANLSSEAPDVENFFGFNWGLPGLIPPIGTDWDIPRTPTWCVSQVSDIDAQLCADNNQTPGTINGGKNGDKGNGWGPPGGPHTPYFFNQSQSCSFICPDGSPFTFTVAAGTFSALNQDAANSMAYSWACRFAFNNRVCFGTFARYGCVNTEYHSSMTIDNANGPYTVTLTAGSLPPGLTPSSAPSIMYLDGTPTTPGNYTFTLNAVDRNGNTSSKTFTISIIGITNIDSITPAMEHTAYSYQFVALGGTGPYTYTVVGGGAPGITLSSSGLLSGTPDYTTAGDYPITVKVADSSGNSCTQTGVIHISLRPGPDWTKLTWPTYTLNQGGAGSHVTGSAIANVASGNIHWAGTLPFAQITPVQSGSFVYEGPSVTSIIRITATVNPTFGSVLNMASEIQINGAPSGLGVATGITTGTHDFALVIPISGPGTLFSIYDIGGGNQWATCTGVGATNDATFTWTIFNQ